MVLVLDKAGSSLVVDLSNVADSHMVVESNRMVEKPLAVAAVDTDLERVISRMQWELAFRASASYC